MSLSPRFLVCALFLVVGAPLCGSHPAVWAQDAPDGEAEALAPPVPVEGTRVGAARALLLVDSEGRPLSGVLSEPKWETRGGGLFFTREWGGTRNIWRAFPDARDNSRYPRWLALPVTQFTAPLFASGASPLKSDRAILMLSNAANPAGGAQVTYFDLQNRSLRALSAEPDGVLGVAPAPGGDKFAYVAVKRSPAQRGRAAEISLSVWIQNLNGGAESRKRVADNSWRPTWQNATSLLVEGVPNQTIFRLPVGDEERGARATQIASGTQVSASRDGSTLVMMGKSGDVGPLYLLSGDGSGLRALISTEGAQSPALSGDGQQLAFTAPLSSETERALWILPLESGGALNSPVQSLPVLSPPEGPTTAERERIAQSEAATRALALQTRVAVPLAQIKGVQNAPGGGLAILGMASGAGASATLEIGQGTAPRRWEARRVDLPLAPESPLLVWNPSPSARGVWSFRLTVSNSTGAAQSLFSVQLPLASRSPRNPPRVVTPAGVLPAGGPLPSAPLPDLPAAPLPSPAPLPPLLPAPPPRDVPSGSIPNFPAQPDNSPRVNPGSASPSEPAPVPSPSPQGTVRDAATFNVSNTLAQMKAGQSVEVTFWALNRGTRAWEVGATREGVVRLVTRWVRFDNGNRNGWTYQTMKTPVMPGARTRWNFNLVAPTQPGRYKLIYALQRVTPSWSPPEYNAAQETWPGDFEAIAFAVNVKP